MKANRLGQPSSVILLALAAALAAPVARAEDVITMHRLSAVLAVEAVTEAVATCAKQGYRISAAVLDIGGLPQATLRGDGATPTSLDTAHDKAFTVIMLGASRDEDSTASIVERMGANPNAGGLVKLPHIIMAQGGLRIKIGNEAIGAIGASGAPGGNFDEACAKAGLDKITSRLK